jgi:hypothetical protein
MSMVLPAPSGIPQFSNPLSGAFSGSLDIFPIVLDFSPLALVIVTMLAGIFTAAVSVILVYHWRRFPFEQEIFRTVERVYFVGVILLLAVSVFGILLAV